FASRREKRARKSGVRRCMANDAMAVCAAGSMGVGPGVKRRFLRNIQRILRREMNLVYRNGAVLDRMPKALTTKATKSHKRISRLLFPSCTFVPFVVLAFRLASIIPP